MTLKKNIFTRTYDKKTSNIGMGIGLSLIKKIIDTYDVNLYIEDNVKEDYKKWSNFIVELIASNN